MGDPSLKITKAKRAISLAKVVEHLPHKHKTPSSNPSTAKKKNCICTEHVDFFSCHYFLYNIVE
jgi:hypothetical protein